jgi:hypothetical protein
MTKSRRSPARNDVGADSTSERARLQMRIQELEHDKRRLEIRCLGLEAELDDLKREKACLQQAAAEKEPRS